MISAANERRMAPRVVVRCAGELASGTSVLDILISDLSVTGCGVEIQGDPEDGLGESGVLSVQAPSGAWPAVLLPITICNNRVEGGRTRLGLRFRPLTMKQVKAVIAVMDGTGRDRP